MKKQITIALIAIAMIAFSFKLSVDKTTATAEQVSGIYVYAYSKPVSKYDIIGTVKLPGIISDRCDKRLETLIERSKKNFPSGEALILNAEFGNAEVIRFKD